ncbi:tyrosine-protein kinase domain-containing protein [Deinococcus sonorensis]|uniref:AAA family ATPase n=2 Tax=Deinococcus sonorensis TaxID=309891 RepID=A0AAU7UDZ5_9DEIO
MTQPNDDINLLQVLGTLRRSLLPIMGATVLVGAGTYLASRAQHPVYESRSSIISLYSNMGNQVVNSTVVTAPPLPQGALDEAMRSKSVTNNILKSVMAAHLDAAQTNAIRRGLQNSLATGKNSLIKVNSRLDTLQRGVYEIVAHASSPRAASVLSGATVNALLGWDAERAQRGVSSARKNIESQLQSLDTRLKTTSPGSADYVSLTTARGVILQNLAQMTALEQTSSGTLSAGADPSDPISPVSPRPLRNAVLAALLTLFAASGLVLLLGSLRRRVNNASDLVPLGLPLLGQLPLMKRSELTRGILGASRSGRLYDALGFLRINLSTAEPKSGRILAVTSAAPGAGKSSLSAALASSFAEGGLRVLLIDADLHRPTQHRVWNMNSTTTVRLPGATKDGQATLPHALMYPDEACALRDPAQAEVDLLPAGQPGRQRQQLLNHPDLAELLRRWATGYDLILIDTPPVLALADTLALTLSTDGVLLVVESGVTSLDEVERVQQIVQQNGIKLLGAVLNKLPRSEQRYYYGYSYTAPSQK